MPSIRILRSLAHASCAILVVWLLFMTVATGAGWLTGWLAGVCVALPLVAVAVVGAFAYQVRHKDEFQPNAGSEVRLTTFVLLGAVALALWIILSMHVFFNWHVKDGSIEDDSKLAKLGQAGDSFGGISSLFSGAAFLGALFTIYKQHVDSVEADKRHDGMLTVQKRLLEIQGYASLIEIAQHNQESLLRKIGITERFVALSHNVSTHNERAFVEVLNELVHDAGSCYDPSALHEFSVLAQVAIRSNQVPPRFVSIEYADKWEKQALASRDEFKARAKNELAALIEEEKDCRASIQTYKNKLTETMNHPTSEA